MLPEKRNFPVVAHSQNRLTVTEETEMNQDLPAGPVVREDLLEMILPEKRNFPADAHSPSRLTASAETEMNPEDLHEDHLDLTDRIARSVPDSVALVFLPQAPVVRAEPRTGKTGQKRSVANLNSMASHLADPNAAAE